MLKHKQAFLFFCSCDEGSPDQADAKQTKKRGLTGSVCNKGACVF